MFYFMADKTLYKYVLKVIFIGNSILFYLSHLKMLKNVNNNNK